MAIKTLDLSEETSDSALATVEPKQLAVAGSFASQGASGDISQTDLVIPYLALVQKVGTKADQFTPGSWVVGDNVVAGKDEHLTVTALSIQKNYEEVVEYGSGNFGRVFDSAQEVRAAGLSLQRGAANEAREIAGILFWIESPNDADETVFPLETSEGRRGTVAKFIARSTSYGVIAAPIFTALSPLGHLRGRHIKTGQWDLSSFLKKGESNSYFKAVFKSIKEPTPADVIELVDSLGITA